MSRATLARALTVAALLGKLTLGGLVASLSGAFVLVTIGSLPGAALLAWAMVALIALAAIALGGIAAWEAWDDLARPVYVITARARRTA